jgi:hypothetical protein
LCVCVCVSLQHIHKYTTLLLHVTMAESLKAKKPNDQGKDFFQRNTLHFLWWKNYQAVNSLVRGKSLRPYKKGKTGCKNPYITKMKSFQSSAVVSHQIKPVFFLNYFFISQQDSQIR